MLRINNQTYQLREFENDFCLLENLDGKSNNLATGKLILDANLSFVAELIATECEICIKLKGPLDLNALQNIQMGNHPEVTKNQVLKIPVDFELGADWLAIEEHLQTDRQDIINQLLQCQFKISMLGFLPGFLYMTGLPQELHIPRKSTPDKFIDANSLAIGNHYLGYYSLPSPGGWHTFGRSAVKIINWKHLPPIDFDLNCIIKLEAIDSDSYHELLTSNTSLQSYNGEH